MNCYVQCTTVEQCMSPPGGRLGAPALFDTTMQQSHARTQPEGNAQRPTFTSRLRALACNILFCMHTCRSLKSVRSNIYTFVSYTRTEVVIVSSSPAWRLSVALISSGTNVRVPRPTPHPLRRNRGGLPAIVRGPIHVGTLSSPPR